MDKGMLLAEAQVMADIQGHARTVLALFVIGLAIGWLARRARRRREGRLDGLMRPTLLARLASPLPADAQLIAGIGTGRAAQSSLDAQVMRASAGLRILVVALVGMMGWYILGPGPAPVGWGDNLVRAPAMEMALLGGGLWSVLWTFTWELRWDRDGLTLTRAVFFRTTRRWRDLNGIRDSRHHDYILTFDTGDRLSVLKNATGIDAFLTRAAAELRKPDTDPRFARQSGESVPCPSFPKSKPSAPASSRPWRGGAS